MIFGQKIIDDIEELTSDAETISDATTGVAPTGENDLEQQVTDAFNDVSNVQLSGA